MTIDFPYYDDKLNELAYSIIKQAVDDWRWLCEGNKERGDCNFTELERFFEVDSRDYLLEDGVADRIYKKLKAERRKALKREKRKAHM